MEQTLQAQYNLIKEGKGNKAVFLKSAYRLFPDMLSPVNTFEDTIKILKNRSIISEGIGGLVTTGKKQDWMSIFNENMDKLKDEKNEEDSEYDEMIKRYEEEEDAKHTLPNYRKLKEEERTQAGLGLYLMFDKSTGKLESFMDTHNHKEDDSLKKQIESKGQYVLHFVKGSDYSKFKDHFNDFKGKTKKELNLFTDDEMKMGAQAVDMLRGATVSTMRESKEPSKEVLDNQKNNFDYKDEKNYDNLFGQEFLKGYYTELKDPKNADKDVEELRAIVAKNLAKDNQYYVKDGQFGVKGLGYTTEAPGLGEPKEPKGKFASSGYGDIPKTKDLKESVLRSQIHLLIKEVLNELQQDPKAYADEEEFSSKLLSKIKSDIHSKNKHYATKYGEPDTNVEFYLEFAEKNMQNIIDKFFDHTAPEGGMGDAVKYVLAKVDSSVLHEAKKKASDSLTKEALLAHIEEFPSFKKDDKVRYNGKEVKIVAVPMHAKKYRDEPQTFSYTIETEDGTRIEDIPLKAVEPLQAKKK